MAENEIIIQTFYSAFQKIDYKTMQLLYSDDASFSDPVFPLLHADEVRSMWEMFCRNSADLTIDFKNIQHKENRISAEWTAHYSFPLTKRMVNNHIKADFVLEDDKIIRHHDSFSFYRWSRQALGPTGWLLGWSPIVKNKVRKSAAKSLAKFMQK